MIQIWWACTTPDFMNNVWYIQGAQTFDPQIELKHFNIKLYQIQTWIMYSTTTQLSNRINISTPSCNIETSKQYNNKVRQRNKLLQ